jgi:hypothetical protein
MALEFLGDPLPGQEVRHLDGVKTNLSLSNLAWGTRSENLTDDYRHNPNRKTLFKKGHKYGVRFGAGQKIDYSKIDYQEITRKAWETRRRRYGPRGRPIRGHPK